MHRMIPVRGVLQEARVPQELGTPIYIDSSSTTFVATNRAAPKKSTWVRRKSEESRSRSYSCGGSLRGGAIGGPFGP